MVMAPTTPNVQHRDSHKFSSVLSYALSEWVLMLLLFLDGLFSYLVTKFARVCKLQTPCLICSRLDHILGNEKPGFYQDLICNAHKSEILSLAYFDVHEKLADTHDMRQDCAFSFAKDKKANPESCRPSVGKLGMNLNDTVNAYPGPSATFDDYGQHSSSYVEDEAKVPVLNKDLEIESPLTSVCSFCSKSFISTSDPLRLPQSKPIGIDVAEVGISLSNSRGRSRENFHDASSLSTNSSLVLPAVSPEDHGLDRLPHIGNDVLHVVPDPESEIPVSLEDDGAKIHGTGDFKGEISEQYVQKEPVIAGNGLSTTISDDKAVDKLIHPAPTVPQPLVSITGTQLSKVEVHDIPHMTSSFAIGHDAEEANCQEVELNPDPPESSEIISQIISQQVPLENSNGRGIVSSSSGEVSMAVSPTESNLKLVRNRTDSNLSLLLPMDLNDAYKLVIGSKSNLTSPSFTEVVTGSSSSRVHEDLKSMIRQLSSSSRPDSPWIDLIPSPRVTYLSDEFKFNDASSSAILHNITKRMSIDRNESGFESLDGSVVSEIEGESVADRLKRQVELDRKSINLLYKELEEERSASTIAANQAMAMITRLQQEKAAMQMEAFQYQRVMEDQAEYDQEVVQKLNELLAQREKDIQDLEAELETYRKRRD